MSPFTDEELVAYADGELPTARAEEIARAEQNDPALALRIKAFGESRRALRDAFAGQLDKPVPQRLLDVLGDDDARVVAFRPRARLSSTWISLALAASVALAVGIGSVGWFSLHPPETPETLVSRALETMPSGVSLVARAGDEEIVPLSTLQTSSGISCREYAARSGLPGAVKKSRGLACRNAQGRWETRATAAEDDRVTDGATVYVTASGGGDNLASILGQARQLTPPEEQDQINKHWGKGEK